jgi:pimeloyl-ACP methyl ester carboxylesterase
MGVMYFVIFLMPICSLVSCLTFRKGDLQTIKLAKKYAKEITVQYFDHHDISVRFVYYQNVNQSAPLIVLIHGAPGSSSAFMDYLKSPILTDNYSIIIVDRLGYGYSDYGRYAAISDQSHAIIALIHSVQNVYQDVFIAGHSYGGTITAAIACFRPEFLTASVLMAPAIDPENEKYFWFSKLGKWKATRWMASGALKVATDEKYNHAKELKEWEDKWENINTPVLHIHGSNDNVVPFLNLEFSKKKFSERVSYYL